jgi:starch-binding outer membrane protein, SusD/RagB family
MGKYKFIVIGISIVAFATGCQKFLETKSELFVEDGFAIRDRKSAGAAVIGMYNQLSSNGYNGNTFRYIANLSSDNLRWVGNSPINREFWVHEVFATNSRVLELWRAIYATINIANNILEKVPVVNDVTYNANLRNNDRGEAFFVRAYSYFDLARLWGNVPLTVKATSRPEDANGIGNSSREQVLRLVENDLDSALNLLPTTVNRNRANRSSALALKARLHLYRKEWQEAINRANDLIGNSAFQLVKPYNSFFLSKNTQESIFEIAYTVNNRNAWAPNWFASNITGGRRELLPTDGLISLLNNPSTGGDRKSLLLPISGIIYGNMNFRIATGDDPVYAIRIAEMYLIRAEAYANLNRLQEGLSDLNTIRQRANAATIQNVASTNELLGLIATERRLEFAYESHRWFDLIRTGKAVEVLNLQNEFRQLLPIPTQELLVNSSLVQNQGY